MAPEVQTAVESVGLAGTLGLDIKLFLAQLVNFGLVVFVMWRWVYRPLLKAMDERTAKIDRGLKDAEASATARADAEKQAQLVMTEARNQARSIMEQANVAAAEQGTALVAKAKREVESIVAMGKSQLAVDKDKMLTEVKAELSGVLALAVERITNEKIDPKKDAALIKSSLEQIGQI